MSTGAASITEVLRNVCLLRQGPVGDYPFTARTHPDLMVGSTDAMATVLSRLRHDEDASRYS